MEDGQFDILLHRMKKMKRYKTNIDLKLARTKTRKCNLNWTMSDIFNLIKIVPIFDGIALKEFSIYFKLIQILMYRIYNQKEIDKNIIYKILQITKEQQYGDKKMRAIKLHYLLHLFEQIRIINHHQSNTMMFEHYHQQMKQIKSSVQKSDVPKLLIIRNIINHLVSIHNSHVSDLFEYNTNIIKYDIQIQNKYFNIIKKNNEINQYYLREYKLNKRRNGYNIQSNVKKVNCKQKEMVIIHMIPKFKEKSDSIIHYELNKYYFHSISKKSRIRII